MRASRYIRLIGRNALPIAAVIALCSFSVAMAQSVQSFSRKVKPQVSSTTKFIINRRNVAAGDSGRGKTVVRNRSKGPMKIRMTQLPPSFATSALAVNLKLSIHDDTAKRCYWPTTNKGACKAYGAWNATKLKRRLILPKKKGKRWKKGEKHTFTIAWQLNRTASNAAQGGTSAFVLQWKATPK